MIEIISVEYSTPRKNSAVRKVELKRKHYVESKGQLDELEHHIAKWFKTTRDNVYIRTKDKGKHYPSEAHFMGEKY